MTGYYVARGGEKLGPFEEAEILRRIEERVLSSDDLCWGVGMADWQPIAVVLRLAAQKPSPPPIPPTPTHAVQQAAPQAAPLFLHISIARLILMSIVSFSLYEAYWMYKNWRYLKERDNLNISPFWRGWFGIFYCHSLLRRIHEDKAARSVQLPSFSPGGLATTWVVLFIISAVLSRAPGFTGSIIAAFLPSFLCFVPVQNYVNSVSERRSPGRRYYRWSSGHVVCLLFGIIIWGIILIGLGAK